MDWQGQWALTLDTPGMVTAWAAALLAARQGEGACEQRRHRGPHARRAQVYSLRVGSWQWREHTADVTGEAPSPRSGHAAVALPGDRHLLVFGGGALPARQDRVGLGLGLQRCPATATCSSLAAARPPGVRLPRP